MSSPRNFTVPALGGLSPVSTLNSVVLPAPFGPDDGEGLCFRDLQADAVQDLQRPVAHLDALRVEDHG